MESSDSLDQGRARALAGTFDALVRGVRSKNAHLDTLVARALSALSEAGRTWLHFEALCLRVGGFRSPDTRWTLPIFLSGVRALRSTPDCRADDVLQLAERLVATAPSAEGAEALQDWVYSDGASGFEVVLAPSFVESFEAADAVSLASTSAILALRARALGDDSESTMSVTELDRAGHLPTLAVSVDLYERRVESRELELDGRRMRNVALEAESFLEWTKLELSLAVQPDSRVAYPTRRLARLLRTRVGLGVDDSFVFAWQKALAREVSTELENPSESAFAKRIHTEDFLRAVGTGASSLEGNLLETVRSLPPGARVDVALAHLVRDPPPKMETFGWLVDDTAAAHELAGRSLDERTLSLLLELLPASATQMCEVLLRASPPEHALAALERSDRASLAHVAVEIARNSTSLVVDRVLVWLSTRGRDEELIRLLGGALRAAPSAVALHRAMMRLRSQRAPSLLSLARERKASVPVRRAAMEAAYQDETMRAELLKFRFAEWLDPGEVAHDLRLLRARAKRPDGAR